MLIKCFDCRKYHPESETVKILEYWVYDLSNGIHSPEYEKPIFVCKGCLDTYIKRNEGV